MAISTYAFQPRRWNARNDDLQTITGLFGSWSGTSFIGASCEAGFLANADVGIPADLKGILKEEDVKFLTDSAYADACRPGNPRECTPEDIEKLYRSLM